MALPLIANLGFNTPLSPIGAVRSLFKKKVPPITGSEALNPEAQALHQQGLARQAQLGSVVQPVQPVLNAPRPVQRPTGATQGTPVDPATAQLQQEAANLAKYGNAQGLQVSMPNLQPEAPKIPEGWDAQTYANFKAANPGLEPNAQDTAMMLGAGEPQTIFDQYNLQPSSGASPVTSFADTYKQLYQQLGLNDIRNQYDDFTKQFEDLQNKKVDELGQIDANPWLTEGERQDRKRSIESKYQQREANMTGRLDLLRSNFEQGRQEAEFIASQALTEQRQGQQFQQELRLKAIDQAERRAEAERKLQTEKGKRETSVVEINGRKVLVDTQTGETVKDLGAITRAVTGGASGSLDKILTVEEALKLGVPYGTTRGEAVGRFASGSSGEAAKLQGIVTTLPTEIASLKGIMQNATRTQMLAILSGVDTTTSRLIDQVADKVGRLRSGGAINKEEEARFRGQIIRKADLLTGDTSSAISALDGLALEASQVAKGIRVGSSGQETQGSSGTTSSGVGYTILP